MQDQNSQRSSTFGRVLYVLRLGLVLLLKVLVVMTVAGLGGGAIGAGLKSSHDGGEVGFGTFALVGAFFLYRMWFGRPLSQRE
jgi:hypothetical protein